MEARESLEPVAQWAREWFRKNDRPFETQLEGLVLKVRGTDTFVFPDGSSIGSLFDLGTLASALKGTLDAALDSGLASPHTSLRLWVELKEILAADRELLAFLDEIGRANAASLRDVIARFGYLRHGEWTYRGECIVGESGARVPHGLGSALRRDGTRYLGNWRNGVRQGQGRCRFGNGLVYEGAYENGVEAGFGRLRKDKAWMYEGSFAQGAQNGAGRLTLAGGEVFDGQFRAGSLEGPGLHMNSRGDAIYIGGWSAGKREGAGIFVQVDGTREQGEWRKNRLFEGERLRFHEREGRYRREYVRGGKSVFVRDVSFMTRRERLQSALGRALAPAGTVVATLAALVTLAPIVPFSAHVGLAAFAFFTLVFACGARLRECIGIFAGRMLDARGHAITDWDDSTRRAAKAYAHSRLLSVAPARSRPMSAAPARSPQPSAAPERTAQATPRRPAA
jgi:hypothetical protein